MTDQNNNDKVTITSEKDGTFKINTGKGEHHASYKNQGGADVIQMGQEYVERDQRASAFPSFTQVSGVLEVDDNGHTKVLNVETYTPDQRGFSGSVLENITDLAGRRVGDLSLVRQNPANFKAVIGGTEATIESLLHAGVLRIGGDGNFTESMEQRMHLTHPRDKSNPLYEAPKAEERILMPNIVRDFTDEKIRAAGLDPASVYSQAIGNGLSAAKTVSDSLGDGTSPESIHEDILAAVQTTLSDAAVMLERKGMVEKGHGALVLDFALNKCSEKVGKKILQGLMVGHKAAYQEAVHRWLSGDRF